MGVFCGVILCLGCTDRLSGPEAVKLVDALEESLLPTRRLDRLWWELGFTELGELSRIGDAATAVVLHRDGRPLTYRAVVLERVMAPGAELDPLILDCAGRTHWRALLWREGNHPEGMVLWGGWFHQQLVSQLERCPDVPNVYLRPAPSLLAFLPDTAPNRSVWLSTEGEADISPGQVIGDCTFLTADAARDLRQVLGLTCEITRHRVWLQARVRRRVSSPDTRALVLEPSNGFRLELRPTEIIGIRYTFHCDGARPERVVLCARHRDRAP